MSHSDNLKLVANMKMSASLFACSHSTCMVVCCYVCTMHKLRLGPCWVLFFSVMKVGLWHMASISTLSTWSLINSICELLLCSSSIYYLYYVSNRSWSQFQFIMAELWSKFIWHNLFILCKQPLRKYPYEVIPSPSVKLCYLINKQGALWLLVNRLQSLCFFSRSLATATF